MANEGKDTYSSLEPGGSVTVLSMDGGEMNLFGSTYTSLELSETRSYPKIQDDLIAIPPDPTKGLIAGLAVAAVFAGLAIATVATGGAALAAVALAGAAVGTTAAAVGMYQSDIENGYDRSVGEYAMGLAGGAALGAIAGAFLYWTAAAAPAAGAIASMDAGYYLGVSGFTQNVVPAIVTNGVYGLTITTGAYTVNDIYANNSGYNVVLDKVFDNDREAYEAFGLALWFTNGAVVEYVSINAYRGIDKQGVQYERGSQEKTSSQKPYAKHRPSYGPGQVEQVWENAKDPVTGKVYDPSGAEITWDRTRPRSGQWDMGHIPGQKYSDRYKLYMDGQMTLEEFLEWYRNPANYRPELPSTNRGHKFE